MKWGQYILTLVALAALGCASDSLVGSLPVVPDPAHAATVVVMRQYNFEGSGVAPTITIDGLATYELGVSEHVAIPVAPGEKIVLHRARGCEACRGVGYSGRIAVMEFLTMTDAIRRLVLRHAESGEIHRTGASEGMRSMYEDGLLKAVAGVTSIDEVLRVTRDIVG